MNPKHLLAALALLGSANAQTLTLWPKGPMEPAGFAPKPEEDIKKADGIRRVSHVSTPTLTLSKPAEANGCCVLVCPGGGYNILAIEHEGTQVCDYLNSLGITTALLKYRVPRRDNDNPSKYPLQDAQRAMGMLRLRAAEYGIDPKRIGILGFSAGGHLCVMTALHANERSYELDPGIEAADATPNFAIPVYPAYLVGRDNEFKLLPEISVKASSPPLCLVHAHDDRGVTSAAASALLYLEYKQRGLPAELHIYAKGGHGFGMKKTDLPTAQWLVRCGEWLKAMGFLAAK